MSVKLLTLLLLNMWVLFVVTMTLDLKSGFPIWKFITKNLDLDGTRVYVVVACFFAASPLMQCALCAAPCSR